MKCPVCKEPSLVISERKGVEIDYCPECRGVWLDRGELDKILEKSRAEDGNFQQERPSHEGYQQGHQQKPYKRKKSIFEELFD
jgi:Zn-finger nucleic acid-binding protein